MTTRFKSIACMAAVAALAFAPSAFAGHGRHGGYHGFHGHRGHVVRYHGGHGYYRYHHYHRDNFGRWVAGAVVLGALTHLVVDATQPRVVYYDNPTAVVYEQPPVVYRSAPVTRVYRSDSGSGDPYQTRYIGHDDSYDGH
jgi:hypothetical protein